MLRLDKIHIKFKDFELHNVELEVNKGEYHVLLGPSGAGKSVLLNIIAGFYHADSGNITLGEENITNQSPQKRNVAILFQDLALFPHLNVFDNVAFPLRIRKLSKTDIKLEVEKYLNITGISELKNRRIQELSGGEKQRVAIARCLVTGAELLLLDEPLTAIDTQLRNSLKILLKDIQKLGKTIIHVTHDLKETRLLADRISVLVDGKLVKTGTYDEVLATPDSYFTANFNESKNYFEIVSIDLKNGTATIQKGADVKIITEDISDFTKGIFINPNSVMINNLEADNHCNKFNGTILSLSVCNYGIEAIIDVGFSLACNMDMETFKKLNLQPGDEIVVSFLREGVKPIVK